MRAECRDAARRFSIEGYARRVAALRACLPARCLDFVVATCARYATFCAKRVRANWSYATLRLRCRAKGVREGALLICAPAAIRSV